MPVGHVDAVQRRRAASAASRSEITRSTGSSQLRARALPRRERLLRELDVLVRAQRRADRVALRREEREAHRAADQDRVGELAGSGRSRGSCRSPWRRRAPRPAGARDPRAARSACSPRARAAARAALGHEVGDALGRGVRAVRGAERVVDVDVGERRELRPRARDRSSSRPARSGRSPAAARRRVPSFSRERRHLIADDRRAPASPARRAARRAARPPAPATAPGRGPSGARGARRASGCAPRSRSSCDRRQRGADPRVVGDRAAGERDVEVDPYEHALAVAGRRGPRAFSQRALDQVDDPVRVAPLVVVPGDDLDHRAVHDRGQRPIDDRRRRVLDDVGGDDRVLGVLEDARSAARRRGRLQRAVDLLDGRRTVGLDRQVDDAAGRDGRADREAVQLARSAPGSRARSPWRRRSWPESG